MQSLQTSEITLPDFHPKQLFAYESKAVRQLYGGATRGGKTAFVKLALIRWCSTIPGLQCDIFRFNHDDVIAQYMQAEFSFPSLLGQWVKDKLVEITQTEVRFWNGSLISLEHCSSDKAMGKHQGIDKHVRVFDEAGQIPWRRMKWLTGWVTMSNEMLSRVPPEWRGQFPKVIYLSNPIGASAGELRRIFVKSRPKTEIGEVDGITYQYIPAKVEDNPSVNAEDTRRRVRGATDEATARALLEEDWDAPIGDFIREYSDDLHCVPDLIPPAWWLKWRSFDWGKSEPFCVLWLCLSDGEPFTDQKGVERWFPRGAVIVYREWYGCIPESPADGLGLTNKEICDGIKLRTPETISGVTLTDNLPFQRRDDELMADFYAKNGVPLTLGITDRVMGWARVKDMLKGLNGIPMLYICESCNYLRDYLPALQRHETKMEDAVEHGEATHATDTLRIGISSRPAIRDKPKSVLPQDYQSSRVSMSTDAILRKLKKQQSTTGRRV